MSLIYNFKNEDITVKNCIAICIDIRDSTVLNQKQGTEQTSKIIASFISNCYTEMHKTISFDNCIYAGDGIIGIIYTDNNEKAFDKTFKVALDIKKIILKYRNYFDAGIGISFAKTVIIQVPNLRTKINNTLYTGDSISISTKLCSPMPFQNDKYKGKRYIAMSIEFHKKLNLENQRKCQKTNKKVIEKETV